MKNPIGVALALMCKVFEDVTDRGGHPYAGHCIRVWHGVLHLSVDAQIAAILHDVVEDTAYTNEDLVQLGFSLEVIRILTLLTHDKENISYDDYIRNIAGNADAAEIKKSDLTDNMDLKRLKGVTKRDMDRAVKYLNAYHYLSKL